MPSKETLKNHLDDGTGLLLIGALLAATMTENLVAVSNLMDNTLSTNVQYVIAAACTLIEAFGFVKARQCWRAGRWCTTAAIALLTFVTIAVSVFYEATFYNVNFANKAQTLASKVDVSHDIANEKAEIEKRLADAGSIRPTGVIEADITLALAKPAHGDRYQRSLDRMTKGCTNTRSGHYDECGKVLELRKELETSTALGSQIAKDRERLEAIRSSQAWVTTIGVTRPGAAIIADVVNGVRAYVWNVPEDRYVSDESVQTALIVLLMAALQLANIILPLAWFGNEAVRPASGKAAATAGIGLKLVDGASNDNRTLRTWPTDSVVDWNSFDKWLAAGIVDKLVAGAVGQTAREQAVDRRFIAGDEPAAPVSTLGDAPRRRTKPAVDKPVAQELSDAAIRFAERCCTRDNGQSDRSDDFHAAYLASIDCRSGALTVSHLTRKLRRHFDLPRDETHRSGQKRTIRGLRLNDEGRRLLVQRRAALILAAG